MSGRGAVAIEMSMMPGRMNLAHSMHATMCRSVRVDTQRGRDEQGQRQTIPQITLAEINSEEGEQRAVAGSCARLVESET